MYTYLMVLKIRFIYFNEALIVIEISIILHKVSTAIISKHNLQLLLFKLLT